MTWFINSEDHTSELNGSLFPGRFELTYNNSGEQVLSMAQDIRYKQRLQNYTRALVMVQEGVELSSVRPLTNMEKQGVIKSFEFSYELAWNLMKDYALFQGHHEIRGSRDAIRQALSIDLISDGEIWMDMLESRNITSHTYDELIAEEILQKIVTQYFPAMIAFQKKMGEIADAD